MNNQNFEENTSSTDAPVTPLQNQPVPVSPPVIDPFQKLEMETQKIKVKEGHMKAYMVSIFIPPLGIFYFLKYLIFNREDEDKKKAGIICLILTVASLAINLWLLQFMFNSAVTGNSQEMNMLKDLITPANQDAIIKLYQ